MKLAKVAMVIFFLVPPLAAMAQSGPAQAPAPQRAPIYDNSYAGPRNYQGIPTYEPVARPKRQTLQNPYTAQPQGQHAGQYGQSPMYGQYQQGSAQYGNPYGQAQQPRQYHNTPFHRLYRGAASVGGYLWQYMPAPLRGAENDFMPAPGSGNVIITNVGPIR
jgi:hypothetical protein